MSQDYNSTLNLPKTDFPMRAGLPKSGLLHFKIGKMKRFTKIL